MTEEKRIRFCEKKECDWDADLCKKCMDACWSDPNWHPFDCDYNGMRLEKNLAPKKIEELTKAKDQAYWERNQLVLLLSKIFPSHLCLHEGEDWEDDWRTIVCIHTPADQCTWHIHDSEKDLFNHLKMEKAHWDGHTVKQKYERLLNITKPIGHLSTVPGWIYMNCLGCQYQKDGYCFVNKEKKLIKEKAQKHSIVTIAKRYLKQKRLNCGYGPLDANYEEENNNGRH